VEQSPQTIEKTCLNLLGRREHSQKELLDKLKLRGVDLDQAKPVIAKLAEQGWQSDQRFAESFIRQRIKKGYGANRIACELQQKGVVDFDMDTVLDEMELDWLDVIEQVYIRKYPQEGRISYPDWAKRSRFLQQRGFDGGLIKQLFQHLNIKIDR
jgi:regulatory protein